MELEFSAEIHQDILALTPNLQDNFCNRFLFVWFWPDTFVYFFKLTDLCYSRVLNCESGLSLVSSLNLACATGPVLQAHSVFVYQGCFSLLENACAQS